MRAFPDGARPIPESRSKTGAPRVAHLPRLADLDSGPENNHTWRSLLSREFGFEYIALPTKSNLARIVRNCCCFAGRFARHRTPTPVRVCCHAGRLRLGRSLVATKVVSASFPTPAGLAAYDFVEF